MLLLIKLSQFKFIKTTAEKGFVASNPDRVVKRKVELPLFAKTVYKIR